VRRAYLLWRQQRLFDLWRLWDTEVRKINPVSRVIPNTGGGATRRTEASASTKRHATTQPADPAPTMM
jgi:hypothetical protein